MKKETMDKPKTMLVLSPWFPYPPDNGSRQRIYFLLRELAKTFTLRLVAGKRKRIRPPTYRPHWRRCARPSFASHGSGTTAAGAG